MAGFTLPVAPPFVQMVCEGCAVFCFAFAGPGFCFALGFCLGAGFCFALGFSLAASSPPLPFPVLGAVFCLSCFFASFCSGAAGMER